jgi:hypothetical protein
MSGMVGKTMTRPALGFGFKSLSRVCFFGGVVHSNIFIERVDLSMHFALADVLLTQRA